MRSEEDSVREVNEMSNLKRELVLFWDNGAALGEFFERVDSFHKAAKPSFSRFGFIPNIADETNVRLCIRQRRLGNFNVKCQAFSGVPLTLHEQV